MLEKIKQACKVLLKSDKCKWKRKQNLYYKYNYYVGCKEYEPFNEAEAYYYKFCPYCGREIEIDD